MRVGSRWQQEEQGQVDSLILFSRFVHCCRTSALPFVSGIFHPWPLMIHHYPFGKKAKWRHSPFKQSSSVLNLFCILASCVMFHLERDSAAKVDTSTPPPNNNRTTTLHDVSWVHGDASNSDCHSKRRLWKTSDPLNWNLLMPSFENSHTCL